MVPTPISQAVEPALEEEIQPYRDYPEPEPMRQVGSAYATTLPSRSRFNASVWIPLSFVFLLFGVALGYMVALASGRPPKVSSDPQDFALGLSVSRSEDNLVVKWDRQAPAIRAVVGGLARDRRERNYETGWAEFGESAKRERGGAEAVALGTISLDGAPAGSPEFDGKRGMETMMMRFSLLCLVAASAAFAQPAKFQAHDVAGGLRGGYQVVIADMNGDGKPDLVTVASNLTEVAWFENPGWQKHVIVSDIKQPINLAVVKADKTGVVIVLAHEFSPNAKQSIGTVSVLESTGDVTQPFKRTDIDKLATSHRIRMMNGLVINAPLTNADAVAPDYHGGHAAGVLQTGRVETATDHRCRRWRGALHLSCRLGWRWQAAITDGELSGDLFESADEGREVGADEDRVGESGRVAEEWR